MADELHLNDAQILKLAEAIGRTLTKYASALHPGWFSVESAAAYTDFSYATIDNAIKAGKLKCRKVQATGTGKHLSKRIKREWLDAWIEDQPED
ncbi:helix-turn-helix domain-containing protein [Luteolibacter sp. Populi]|uniref:helix-turn-helix domain-containing protein n=1 Tax=Luteolibacter sp. Populi TaxID=3230487 RepID=UPI003466CE42